MSLLERSRIAAARLKEAEDVRAAYETARGRARVAYLRLMEAGAPDAEMRTAERRLQAADLQLTEARRLERIAWARHE